MILIEFAKLQLRVVAANCSTFLRLRTPGAGRACDTCDAVPVAAYSNQSLAPGCAWDLDDELQPQQIGERSGPWILGQAKTSQIQAIFVLALVVFQPILDVSHSD